MSKPGSVEKAYQIIFALSGHELNGLSAGELAEAAKLNGPDATRYRQRLMDDGMIEEIPSLQGRYRLGPKMIQIAQAHLNAMAREQGKIDEVKQRYSCLPK